MSRNSSTSSSSAHRRFLVAFLLAGFGLLLPGMLVSLFVEPADGNLARIGFVAQRDMGPRAPQERMAVLANGITAVKDPQVLVLGDSFSEPNEWQSEFTRQTGLRTQTWHYRNVPCLEDWLGKAVAGELAGSAAVIVVQVLEHKFFSRFVDGKPCSKRNYPPLEVAAGESAEIRSRWAIFPMDVRHVLKTAARYPQLHAARGLVRSGDTIMVDMIRADLFSNRLSQRLAYSKFDEEKYKRFTAEEAQVAVQRFAGWRAKARANGKQFILLVIPDKSEAYRPYVAPDQQSPTGRNGAELFSLIGEQLGAQYDLLEATRSDVLRYPDLYRPDDTHFSTRGYRLLGERVAGWVMPVPHAAAAEAF